MEYPKKTSISTSSKIPDFPFYLGIGGEDHSTYCTMLSINMIRLWRNRTCQVLSLSMELTSLPNHCTT